MENSHDRSQPVEVQIFGKNYTLVSDQTTDYTRQIASDVDKRMAAVAAEKNLADTTKIAMMAAMEIADELLRARINRRANLALTAEAGKRLGSTVGEAGVVEGKKEND
ncbi:MAG: cell division protein ZapA [Candidatus Latescibacterota bacterium]|nr:cell division protein ZapA [Candidatus Latescibacterota bacterium]